MRYPRTIELMGLNLISIAARKAKANADHIHENNYHMLWNSILTYHFSLALGYGVTLFQTSIAGDEVKSGTMMVVKVERKQENIVLVLLLGGSRDEFKEEVVEELTEDVMEEALKKTKFPAVYGIACIGTSYTVYKLEKSGDPQVVFEWTDFCAYQWNVDKMIQLATTINEMTESGI